MPVTTITERHYKGGANLSEGTRKGPDQPILEESVAALISLVNTNETNIATLDAYVGGLKDPKDSVRLATAAALNACTAAGTGEGKTLTQDSAAIENIDGQAVVVGDRILVKDQVAGEDNGIYVVTVVGTGSVKQVLTRADDADTDAKVTAGMTVPVEEGTANDNTVFMLTTDNPIVLDTDSLTFAEFVSGTHASGHITGGGDEIDGDHLDITLTPSNYSPDTTPSEASDVDHLAAHLAGIDNELVDVEQMEGSAAVVALIQSDQPTTLDTLTVGADVYEVDGVGGNINYALGGSAELTMDALLAAAVASGTEDLYWDKLSATQLRIRNADGPQGNILAGEQSIVLDASDMNNYDFDAGDVNMNTLGGVAAAKTAVARVTRTLTAAEISATTFRMSFPFTPTGFHVTATSSGVPVAPTTDAVAIVGDDVVFTSVGTDLSSGDIVMVTAWA